LENANPGSVNTIYPFWNLLKDIILFINEFGQIEFANKFYVELAGSSLADICGKPMQWHHLEWEQLRTIIETEPDHSVYFDSLEPNSGQDVTLQFVQKFTVDGKGFYLFQGIKPSQELRITKTLLNNTDIAFIYVNRNFLVESFNNAANLLANKLSKKDILIGISIEDIIRDVEGHEAILNSLQSAFDGNLVVFTQKFNLQDGQTTWFEFQINPIANGKNPIQEAAIAIRDITKFKFSEQEIRNSEIIFRNTFNNINDPAVLWQRKEGGEIALLIYNLAASELSDGRFEEWLGRSVKDFYANLPAAQNFIEEVYLSGVKKSSEDFFQLACLPEKKWIASDYIKISDEYLLNILEDITQRKNAEIALAEKQRQYETLLKNLPGMVYRCRNDRDWTMEFVNDGSFELFGYFPHELINNQRIAYAKLIHPEDRETVWNEISAKLEQRNSFEIIYRIITKENVVKWVWERGQGIFDSEDKLLVLEGFISDITERIIFEQRAEKAKRQAEALQEAMAELASQLDIGQVLRRILVTLKKVLEYNSATLYLKIGETVKIVAARGFENTSRLIDRTFPVDNVLLSEIQHMNEPLILVDAQADPRFIGWEGAQNVRGWMGVPLIRHGQFIGFMTIDNHKMGAYSKEEAAIAQTFADEAAIVIENARLYERAQILATSDGLTGIYNRRYFYEVSKKEFERSKRYGSSLSVIMMDIDHFKYVNDRYGHLAGDQVLIQFVERVKDELRGTDILARYGGEEFAILLLESNLDEALQVAERIREVVASKPFELNEARPYITISLGVATNEGDVPYLDMLIDRSDKALYESKQFGRNRVRAFRKSL
jgi:diguanylate cyclase (GGDEF)-like protein/PAS domain S-box-containing protein